MNPNEIVHTKFLTLSLTHSNHINAISVTVSGLKNKMVEFKKICKVKMSITGFD